LELLAHRALNPPRDSRRSQLGRSIGRNSRLAGVAAYDESMAKTDGIRPMRWPLWLAAGMLFGLVLGFAFGLAKPRVRK
jgi:hypothetical protein